MARKTLQTDNPSHAVTDEQMPGLPAAMKDLAVSTDLEKDEILSAGIVAEGVETAEQATFLRDHGCDEAQGYHLGRPLKESDFEALLNRLR